MWGTGLCVTPPGIPAHGPSGMPVGAATSAEQGFRYLENDVPSDCRFRAIVRLVLSYSLDTPAYG